MGSVGEVYSHPEDAAPVSGCRACDCYTAMLGGGSADIYVEYSDSQVRGRLPAMSGREADYDTAMFLRMLHGHVLGSEVY